MSPDAGPLPAGSVAARRLWKRFRSDPISASQLRLASQLRRARHALPGRGSERWRWALRDVDLEVAPGESWALVGANGSGKSTLLKILCRVMYPYAGSLEVAGRVGALIEVRAGLHPDLTGRENVYLYGSLLGLDRRAVTRRFEEIIEFAGITDAVNRQVKFYSSGMQMRLGFAVAAFLEPDVLLVDEVLAVGDTEFQQRCLDRMREVLAEGTTLVLVSHDLAAVEATCRNTLWLRDGAVAATGPTETVIPAYRHAVEQGAHRGAAGRGRVHLLEAQVSGVGAEAPETDGPLHVRLRLGPSTPQRAQLCVGISQGPATPIVLLRHDVDLPAEGLDVACTMARLPLPKGTYSLWVGVFDGGDHDLCPWQPAADFAVEGPMLDLVPPGVVRLAPVHVDAHWQAGSEV